MIKFLYQMAIVCFLHAFSLLANAQTTEIKYLSGTGSDDTVPWEFFCSAGMNSGKWTIIPVPSCWELQGFGTYNYGIDPWEERINEYGMYRYEFVIPDSWKGKKVTIVFEAERWADYWVFGGIYRPVYLEAKPADHIEHIATDARADGSFQAEVFFDSSDAAFLELELQNLNGSPINRTEERIINPKEGKLTISSHFQDIESWSPEIRAYYLL